MKLIMVDQEPGVKTIVKQSVTIWRMIVVTQSIKSPKVEINVGSIHTIIYDELDFIGSLGSPHLEWYRIEGNIFYNHLVTFDQIWVHYYSFPGANKHVGNSKK